MDMREKLQIVNLYLSMNDSPPVKVSRLANILGIKVYEADWPDTVSGKIQKDASKGGESGFAIFVNKSHPETRQRFTIAHEVAHYVLHEQLIGDGIFDDALYRSGLPNKVEAEANGLAADILMPWAMLNKHINKPPEVLAEMFGVSKQAMAIRLGIFG